MKKIFLFCSAGMSTSMLAQKMQEVADQYQLPIQVQAFSHHTIVEIVDEHHPDCVLLGPQVKYLYDETVRLLAGRSIPVAVIDQTDYGLMNGEKVLKSAIKAMKANKEKGTNV